MNCWIGGRGAVATEGECGWGGLARCPQDGEGDGVRLKSSGYHRVCTEDNHHFTPQDKKEKRRRRVPPSSF